MYVICNLINEIKNSYTKTSVHVKSGQKDVKFVAETQNDMFILIQRSI